MFLSFCVSVDLQFVSTITFERIDRLDWPLVYTFLMSVNEGQIRYPAIFDQRSPFFDKMQSFAFNRHKYY